MDWIIILLIAAGAAAGGFILHKRRAPKKSLVPSRIAQKLVKLDPASVSVDVTSAEPTKADDDGSVNRTPIGSASLSRTNRKIYREKKFFYMTTPDKLKSSGQADLKAEGELVRLSFVRRGVPHSVSCRTAGRMKLNPSLVESLDTPVKVAYKLCPVGRIKKEEKRSFLRYLIDAIDDNAGETTPYVSFDVFVRRTDQRAKKSAKTVITDLRVADFKNRGRRSCFNVHTVINQFRAYMLIKPIDQRKVQIERLADQETLVGKIRTQLHQPAPSWTVELLDLEDDVSLDTFCVEQPGGEGRGGHRTVLNPEDRVRVYFERSGKRYEMDGEVDQIGAQYAAIRPIGPLAEEAGLEVSVVDFSAGGALIQGSRKMLEFVLNKPIKAREMSREHPAHEDLLRRFKRHLIHFTFYPKLQFPNVAKRFHPRIPEKICVLGRVIRSEFVRRRGKEVLQYGIQFIHDAHYDAEAEGSTAWRPIKEGHGDRNFNEVHAKLGRLSGFLESQNRDGGSAGGGITQEVRDDRVALVVNKGASTVEQRRKRANS